MHISPCRFLVHSGDTDSFFDAFQPIGLQIVFEHVGNHRVQLAVRKLQIEFDNPRQRRIDTTTAVLRLGGKGGGVYIFCI